MVFLNILILFLIYLIIDIIYKYYKSRNFKGHRILLPIIGSFFHLKDNPHLVFLNDSKKYKISRYFFVDTFTLFINDIELIREIYIKNSDCINSRLKTASTNIIGEKYKGIVTANEVYWKFHREILMKSFTGRKIKSLTSSIEKETNDLINHMKFISKSSLPFKPRNNFMNFNSNIIFDYIFSRRIEQVYECNNEEQHQVLIAVRKFFENLKDIKLQDFSEILKPIYYLYLKIFGHPSDELKRILFKYYKEHCETIDLNNPRDVLDSLIIEFRNQVVVDESSALIPITTELILAGIETNSTTMEWFLLIMCNYQDYQDKLYNELSTIAKSNASSSSINLSNRSQTKLFNSILKEVLRLYPPVPFGVPRLCIKSFNIDNDRITIPIGTQIVQPIYSIHRDVNYWGGDDANSFKPERWYSNEFHSTHYFPYGIGIRNCIGSSFSQDELYLSLTNIILNFKILPLIENQKLNDTPIFGFSFKPIEYSIKLENRK